MYTFICEDSPNGIFSGVYDAWDFKLRQNHTASVSDCTSTAAKPCRHEDIHLASSEPHNYELFCEYIHVTASEEKAKKVVRTILTKLGADFYEAVLNAVLAITPSESGEIDKADAIYRTIVLAIHDRLGAKALDHLSDPYVHRIFTLSRATSMETHHLLGFLRFSELANGVLFSTIHPKNNALPYLAEHFSDRLPQENFMIYDENRQTVAVHASGKNFMLVDASDLNQDILKNYSEKEADFRRLFLTFFEHIAIKARINPHLQSKNIPKRFWGDTVEFNGKLS